jgi:hypothetical protein
MTRALLIAFFFALATPAGAEEDDRWFTEDRWPDVTAQVAPELAVAARFWHADPCAGRWVVRVQPVPRSGLAFARDYECRIIINAEWWPTLLYTAYDRCHLFLHEVGHVIGHEHVDDPTSIMHPTHIGRAYFSACDAFKWRPPVIRHRVRGGRSLLHAPRRHAVRRSRRAH